MEERIEVLSPMRRARRVVCLVLPMAARLINVEDRKSYMN